MQHNCKSQGKNCLNDTLEFIETSNMSKNFIAIVWPFVCSSFADLCISFDEKIKEISARNVMKYLCWSLGSYIFYVLIKLCDYESFQSINQHHATSVSAANPQIFKIRYLLCGNTLSLVPCW